jgi:hypothetical protein
LQAITLARTYDPTDIRIRSSDWFFVPPYDDAWYAALGHWVTARRTDLESVRMDAYDKAIASWQEYLERAPETGHWVAIARARLHACEKEQSLAMKKVVRKPATIARPGGADGHHPEGADGEPVPREEKKRPKRQFTGK